MSVDVMQLRNQISKKVSGYKSGYFVTIDSTITDSIERKINREKLYEFSNQKMQPIANKFSVYCFGLRFLFNRNAFKTVACIEIGDKTKRLHSHLMFLHHGESRRNFVEVEKYLKLECEKSINVLGQSAVNIKSFNPNSGWIEYFTQDTQYMNNKYGFMNIEWY